MNKGLNKHKTNILKNILLKIHKYNNKIQYLIKIMFNLITIKALLRMITNK